LRAIVPRHKASESSQEFTFNCGAYPGKSMSQVSVRDELLCTWNPSKRLVPKTGREVLQEVLTREILRE